MRRIVVAAFSGHVVVLKRWIMLLAFPSHMGLMMIRRWIVLHGSGPKPGSQVKRY
jgi:hypothetical protein